MDLQDIWQAHRRFIVGVLAGVVGFFAARSIVDRVIGTDAALSAPRSTAASIRANALYDTEARNAARERNTELQAEAAALREAVAFTPGEDFVLDGKGDPDTYFPEVARRVRNNVLQSAREYGVELADGDLDWPSPVGREEIARTLVALQGIEIAAERLFDASAAVTAHNPDAVGVQSIEKLAYQSRGGGVRRGFRRRGRLRAEDSSDQVEEHRIAFSIRADVMTVHAWFEALRAERPPLALSASGFNIVPGDQVGDPVLATGALLALTVREP